MKKLSIVTLVLLISLVITNWHSTAENKNEINMDYLVKYGEVKYIVPKTKLTLDALPFTVKIPEYYPFNENPDAFKTSGINYYESESKIESDLKLDNRSNLNERIEIIFGNFPHKDYNLSKNKNIDKKTKGYFKESENYSTIYFVDQDIYYRIDYVNKEKSHKERKEELEKIFNSLTDYKKVFNYKS
ncbi:hypothetical protein [Alkalibacillus almallahensis]|uniref:hypothetical protein n=1 Tax=Alkalibacillus almallahensis TaxID=1379154 RepID=UPI00141F8555|nr:hypothetical protein [Alkalibacillus almallahensis]NIK11147.1 hypothetical protein [Alkalibacillus almallahensis]